MPIDVRPALATYEAATLALWTACGLVVAANDPVADFRRALEGPASAVLLGEEDGHIVGAVMVGHDGHRGWLYYVAASPETRRRGIGRRMVFVAEAWLEERGVPKAMLLVRDTNEAVVPFYEALGYLRQPRVVMAKPLA